VATTCLLITAKTKEPIYSCAIFGEPGSGKSYITEELIKVLRKKTGKKISEPIIYNLTQFNDQKNLIDAFKEIKELKGEIAFVIWDEFDTYYNNNKCGWLPSFLMPMQDSKFFDGKKVVI
jgi:ABC-type dipeptide/oligopeptide/nickel transport system ATPase component